MHQQWGHSSVQCAQFEFVCSAFAVRARQQMPENGNKHECNYTSVCLCRVECGAVCRRRQRQRPPQFFMLCKMTREYFMLDICAASTLDVTTNTAYEIANDAPLRISMLNTLCGLRAPELARNACKYAERKMMFLIRWRRRGNQAISIQLVYFELNRMLFRFLRPASRVAHILWTQQYLMMLFMEFTLHSVRVNGFEFRQSSTQQQQQCCHWARLHSFRCNCFFPLLLLLPF